MLEVFAWLFSTPASVIAFVSAVIAFFAYIHQRKGIRKQNACSIANRYAQEILPRMRYIDRILDLTGVKNVSYKFVGYKDFTEKELNELLLNAECNEEKFKNKLQSVNKEMLRSAFAYSGCNDYIFCYHQALLKVADDTPAELGVSVYKFVIDFLNELEAIAIILHYNIAEEKLIYQSLHQTLLEHMKNWYFFISDQNRNDQDRFFSNLIWLHNTWKKRKCADEESINKILSFRAKAKKL